MIFLPISIKMFSFIPKEIANIIFDSLLNHDLYHLTQVSSSLKSLVTLNYVKVRSYNEINVLIKNGDFYSIIKNKDFILNQSPTYKHLLISDTCYNGQSKIFKLFYDSGFCDDANLIILACQLNQMEIIKIFQNNQTSLEIGASYIMEYFKQEIADFIIPKVSSSVLESHLQSLINTHGPDCESLLYFANKKWMSPVSILRIILDNRMSYLLCDLANMGFKIPRRDINFDISDHTQQVLKFVNKILID